MAALIKVRSMVIGSDIAKSLFRMWPVRAMVALFFLARGALFMLVDPFRGISDFCWIYRVSRIGILRPVAYRIVSNFVSEEGARENRLVRAFLKSEASSFCKRRFLGPKVDFNSIFRDIIVLKPAVRGEKGVLLLKYSAKFDLFVSLFDLDKVMMDYYLVLEPCWAGYCDPSILMFISSKNEVLIQCPEETDFEFVRQLQNNLIPVTLGASDWVDPELFSGEQGVIPKEYDLVMVANWARHKNHRRLFRALPYVKHRPLSLLLIGFDWGGRTEKDIIREMRRYDLQDIRIDIRENLPANEVAMYLNKSKIFLLLSEKEGSNKAIVEALFSDVPAIVYEKFIGGATSKINSQTGVLSSYDQLAGKIDYLIENFRKFTPRSWALEHTGSRNATKKLNDLLRSIAESKSENWSVDIVEKVNNPNLAYKVKNAIPSDQQANSIAKIYLRNQRMELSTSRLELLDS